MTTQLERVASSGVFLLVAITFLVGHAGAICTEWAHDSASMDTGSSFSFHYSQILDQLLCPANATKDCRIPVHTYHVTAPRDLIPSSQKYLGLSVEETDAIFKLAQAGYNNDWNFKNMTAEFLTLDSTVSTSTLDPNSPILEVGPAINQTLFWVPFYRYSKGTLNGCSNETLNNLTVTAAAPYMRLDKYNQTVLAGTWMAHTENTTAAKENGASGAMSLLRGPSSGIAALLFVFTLGLVVIT